MQSGPFPATRDCFARGLNAGFGTGGSMVASCVHFCEIGHPNSRTIPKALAVAVAQLVDPAVCVRVQGEVQFCFNLLSLCFEVLALSKF